MNVANHLENTTCQSETGAVSSVSSVFALRSGMDYSPLPGMRIRPHETWRGVECFRQRVDDGLEVVLALERAAAGDHDVGFCDILDSRTRLDDFPHGQPLVRVGDRNVDGDDLR